MATVGVHRIEFGTMSGNTTVYDICSMVQLDSVRTPIAVGCGVPYGEIVVSSEFEEC
jgi:hypothetical protein